MMTESDYLNLFHECQLTENPKKSQELHSVCRVLVTNQLLYALVQSASGVPWAVVACLHFRESNQDFKKHLHNGDPLTARTVHVPVGRPEKGYPPFTWTASAVDALSEVWRPREWSLPGALEFMERYNGLGYQKLAHINTPYLWDFTSAYTSGLYTADGHFDPAAREARPGAVAILKALTREGIDHELPDEYPTQTPLH